MNEIKQGNGVHGESGVDRRRRSRGRMRGRFHELVVSSRHVCLRLNRTRRANPRTSSPTLDPRRAPSTQASQSLDTGSIRALSRCRLSSHRARRQPQPPSSSQASRRPQRASSLGSRPGRQEQRRRIAPSGDEERGAGVMSMRYDPERSRHCKRGQLTRIGAGVATAIAARRVKARVESLVG